MDQPVAATSPSRAGVAVDALSDLLTAGTYAVTWIAAGWFGERAVATLVGMMVMEFIVVHSSAFIGVATLAPRPRARGVLWLLALYVVFAVAISAAFRNPWFLVGFLWLHANRLVPVLFGRSTVVPGDVERWRLRWGLGALWYLLAVLATAMVPVPRLGVTEALRGYGSGLWIDHPERALAAGVLYFTAQALTSLMPRGEDASAR